MTHTMYAPAAKNKVLVPPLRRLLLAVAASKANVYARSSLMGYCALTGCPR